ncbi:MAG: hypothetical protein ACFE0J_04715 [Elainellaceae cyanobacterium]
MCERRSPIQVCVQGDRSLRYVSKAIAHSSLCPRRSLVEVCVRGDRSLRWVSKAIAR